MAHPRDRKSSRSDEHDTLQVARFCVGDEEYALDIMRIKEIINPVAITRVPRAPDFVDGIIELRGTFMAVIDLRKRFGREATTLGRDGKYIVVRMDDQIVSLIVDRVIDVQRIARADIHPPPGALSGARALGAGPSQAGADATPADLLASLVAGVVKREGHIVLVLDLDAILSPAERDALGTLPTQM